MGGRDRKTAGAHSQSNPAYLTSSRQVRNLVSKKGGRGKCRQTLRDDADAVHLYVLTHEYTYTQSYTQHLTRKQHVIEKHED